jgi:small GTP-binding protein
MTVGFKVTRKMLIYDGVNGKPDVELNLMIWDIMGQKGYHLTPQTAFYGAKGAVMVCDITRKQTLLDLTDLTNNLYGIAENIPIIFMANKTDLTDNHEFNESAIADFAALYKAPYFMTSAKLGNNVEMGFKVLGRMMLKAQGL